MKKESPYTLNRRAFMKGVAGVALGSALSPNTATAQTTDAPIKWRNWSGSVTCNPAASGRPQNESQLVDLVHRANKEDWTVRLAGSGHSFTPLCATDGMTISMADMKGVVDIDKDALQATILGGTKMRHMHVPLREAGMAMENISDIDRQAIAGAIATATHGTGKGLRSISSQVIGLRMLTASGDILDCSMDDSPEIFRGAQVSLGALGIVTHVRMQFLKTYRLHEKGWISTFDETFSSLQQSIDENRHFEFFWVSQRDGCMNKTLNITKAEPDEMPDNENERIGHSDVIFPTVRSRRFNEIEYSVPEENGPDCLLELRELMMGKHSDVVMPLEYRTVGKEDAYLSMANGRDTVTISAHQLAELPHEAFFNDVEAIFRNHHGRPHWGKMHTLKAKELSELYPQWESFLKIREQLDPERRFMNDHLNDLLS
ncbi:MAG: D-arabinono-1,4-lactone oxidase [Candidatus Hydrogenedentota bacterium]